MKSRIVWTVLLSSMVAIAAIPEQAFGQRRGPGARRPDGAAGPGAGGGENQEAAIKPYDEVITAEAVSKPGLFLTHMVKDKLFYEIPKEQLGKDLLWVTQIKKTQSGFSFAGMPVQDRVVRWELRGEKVLLRDVKYGIRSSSEGPVKMAVEATNLAPIMQVFPVVSFGKDQRPVIDVTSLFTSDVSEISPKEEINANGLDSRRSFIEDWKAFPENVDVQVLATYSLSAPSPADAGPGRLPGAPRRDPTQSGVTIVVHHSMLKLPDAPMTPRVYDKRVGFFTVGFEEYGDMSNHQVESVRFVTRWRLEKKDPTAEVSEPVKPIVFYIGREVPDVWKPYVKKGIEMWKPAFEAAGFKNAIEGRMPPTPQEDPSWDPEDARISSIRWLPSTTENAFGPHVHDPRTGEILEADIRVYQNILKLCRDWYFTQASPNDPRAQKLPLPDDLIGELLAYVVAHEVGHSLGFPHNMKASSAFTVANLRDAEFTKKNGTEASIMDYGRFNYVAQPGDNATLIPTIGPYDFFAVNWGYRSFADAEAEKKGLAEFYAQQKTNPLFRFGDADPSTDPTRQTEDLGSDTLAATELGLKNIDRVADFLVSACCKEGEDYDLLDNMYGQLLAQRNRELNHVTALVGGFEEIVLNYGDADRVYTPIDPQRQRDAVKFLIENALRTNPKLVSPDITNRLEVSGTAGRLLDGQRSIINSLINAGRMARMAENVERLKLENSTVVPYAPSELLADLRRGVWTELGTPDPDVDLYRRNLQRLHVSVLARLVKSGSSDNDAAGLARFELSELQNAVKLTVSTKPVVSAHYAQVLVDIATALDPSIQPASAPAAADAPAGRRRGEQEEIDF